MKHEITSANTKRLMSESLKKQMLTKPFSKITVTEIINDCGINRKTFYYHFQDIYDLLKWTFEEEAVDVLKNFDLMLDYREAIAFMLDYIDKNQHIISCVYDSVGRDLIKRFFYSDFEGIIENIMTQLEDELGKHLDAAYKKIVINFYTEALSGSIISWIEDRTKYDREYIIDTFSTIIASSMTGTILGEGLLPGEIISAAENVENITDKV